MGKYKNISWIICFGYDWNSPSFLSPKHIILRFLYDGKKILWINPIPFRNISIRKIGKATFVKKIKNKFKTHIKMLRFPQKNLIVFSPFYLPNVENERIKNINNYFVSCQFGILKRIFRINNFIIWTTGSFTVCPVLTYTKYNFLVYQAADLISDFRGISEDLNCKLLKQEREICERSNIIFTASLRIKDKIESLVTNKEKVVYLPHGVNYQHFAVTRKINRKVLSIRKPIAGYYGSLSNANDQDVFIELAKSGFSVVIIGKISGDYSKCFKYSDIHFFRPVSYHELPSYAQYFDVCLLNWKMAEWIRNCFPLKTLEYLAMGKPVVSVKIPEVEKQFGDLIYFADTPKEFVEKCKLAITEDSDILIVKRKESVENETWDNRFITIKKLLGNL